MEPSSANANDDTPFVVDLVTVRAKLMPPGSLQNVGYQTTMGIILCFAYAEYLTYTITFLVLPMHMLFRAPRWQTRLNTAAFILLFIITRLVFLPVIIIYLPVENFPPFPSWIEQLSWTSFIGIYVLESSAPIIGSFYQLIKGRIWRERLPAPAVLKTPEGVTRWPKVCVVMPIYNEDERALQIAVKTALDLDYPKSRIHLICAFDDENKSDLYLSLLSYLNYDTSKMDMPVILDIVKDGVLVSVCRFEHAGKRHAQGQAYNLMKERYGDEIPLPYILFIDSDLILERNCLHNFVVSMVESDASALTGVILVELKPYYRIILHCQDAEYISGQVFDRALESSLGGVTCLPGALTMVRFDLLKTVERKYFTNPKVGGALDYHRHHLGEDRFLTHLCMSNTASHSIGFCITAQSITECPNTIQKYTKQRRRWLLGAIANEAYMLTSFSLWRRVPFLLLYKLLQFSARSVSMFIYILCAVMIWRDPWNDRLYWFFVAPLLVKWGMMGLIFSLKYRRYTLLVTFPLSLLLQPMLSFIANLYALRTFNERTWGGPRTSMMTSDSVQDAVQISNEAWSIPPETHHEDWAEEAYSHGHCLGSPMKRSPSIASRETEGDQIFRSAYVHPDELGFGYGSYSGNAPRSREGYDSFVVEMNMSSSSNHGSSTSDELGTLRKRQASLFFPSDHVEAGGVPENGLRKASRAQPKSVLFQEHKQSDPVILSLGQEGFPVHGVGALGSRSQPRLRKFGSKLQGSKRKAKGARKTLVAPPSSRTKETMQLQDPFLKVPDQPSPVPASSVESLYLDVSSSESEHDLSRPVADSPARWVQRARRIDGMMPIIQTRQDQDELPPEETRRAPIAVHVCSVSSSASCSPQHSLRYPDPDSFESLQLSDSNLAPSVRSRTSSTGTSRSTNFSSCLSVSLASRSSLYEQISHPKSPSKLGD